MPEHMQRRGGGVYYIRRVVPKDLQLFLRRREIAKSLRTTEFELAKRRCRFESVALDRMFDEKRRAMLAACGAPGGRNEGVERISQRQADLMALDAHEAALLDADRLDPEDDPNALSGAAWEAQELIRDREFRRAAWEEWKQYEHLGLINLFDQYAFRLGLRPATVVQWRGYIRHLIEFLGHDNAHRVTSSDLRNWRKHLSEELQANGKVRRAKTINDSYLASVRATLSWALDEGLLTNNVAASVKPMRSERIAVMRERDLTRQEQQLILSATLRSPSSRLSKNKAAARRWVPWLCAYTGARVAEITQARKQDVCEIDSVWCLIITPEAGSVKTNRARVVPLHPHLIEQGFLRFVNEASGPLFYEPRMDDDERLRPQPKIIANKLACWVRSLGLTEVPQPNHAWRHTFKTLSRSVGIPEGAADYIQGHAPANESRDYGRHDLPGLAREIAKLPRFEVNDLRQMGQDQTDAISP